MISFYDIAMRTIVDLTQEQIRKLAFVLSQREDISSGSGAPGCRATSSRIGRERLRPILVLRNARYRFPPRDELRREWK